MLQLSPCVAALGLLVVSSPPQDELIAFKGAVQTEAANKVELSVEIEIQEGWYVGEEHLSIELELPPGAEASSDWVRPVTVERSDAEAFVGHVVFSRLIEMDDDVRGSDIEVTVDYQLCNERSCLRPTSSEFTVTIPEAGGSTATLFEEPIRIRSGAQYLTGDRYLSPAIYDIDADGKPELVVGNLRGGIKVYEDLNTSGEGDPAWGPPTALKGADGKSIRTTNW